MQTSVKQSINIENSLMELIFRFHDEVYKKGAIKLIRD